MEIKDKILEYINEQFHKIKKSHYTIHKKNCEYGKLMTLIEQNFNIPLLDTSLMNHNKEEIKLYKAISDERNYSIYD